jgi:hypothetical protein
MSSQHFPIEASLIMCSEGALGDTTRFMREGKGLLCTVKAHRKIMTSSILSWSGSVSRHPRRISLSSRCRTGR